MYIEISNTTIHIEIPYITTYIETPCINGAVLNLIQKMKEHVTFMTQSANNFDEDPKANRIDWRHCADSHRDVLQVQEVMILGFIGNEAHVISLHNFLLSVRVHVEFIARLCYLSYGPRYPGVATKEIS